jgi:hypothetical protein
MFRQRRVSEISPDSSGKTAGFAKRPAILELPVPLTRRG